MHVVSLWLFQNAGITLSFAMSIFQVKFLKMTIPYVRLLYSTNSGSRKTLVNVLNN